MIMNADDLDRPEEDGMELVVPFIACMSQGGPFADDAFVAGFQCGDIDRALKAGAAVMAETLRFPMVRTELLKQLELCAMNRGYPHMVASTSEEYPDWSDVRFSLEPIEAPES
jgi:hypothetical protein